MKRALKILALDVLLIIVILLILAWRGGLL